RPISRILSWVAIHLCGYPAPRRAASAEPVRLAPDGVWRADPVARAAGGLLPHRFTLTRRDSGDPQPAGCFPCPFPSAFAASLVSSDDVGSVLPSGVRTFLDAGRRHGHPACKPDCTPVPAPSILPWRRIEHSGQRTTAPSCRTNSPQTGHSSEAPRSTA